jgi:hypothetical protein
MQSASFITCALAAHDSRGRRSEPWTVQRFDEHIERKHHRAAYPHRDQDPKEQHPIPHVEFRRGKTLGVHPDSLWVIR